MRHPLIRQGEGPAASAQRLHQERVELRRTIDRIHHETAYEPRTLTRGTAAGDQRKLRGIPAIGRGVTGAIPGTTPHQEATPSDRRG